MKYHLTIPAESLKELKSTLECHRLDGKECSICSKEKSINCIIMEMISNLENPSSERIIYFISLRRTNQAGTWFPPCTSAIGEWKKGLPSVPQPLLSSAPKGASRTAIKCNLSQGLEELIIHLCGSCPEIQRV